MDLMLKKLFSQNIVMTGVHNLFENKLVTILLSAEAFSVLLNNRLCMFVYYCFPV